MPPFLRTTIVLIALVLGPIGAHVSAQTPASSSRGEEWWTAWSSCDITPVQSPPEQGTDLAQTDPDPIGFLPWLKAETTNASDAAVIVSLWSGDRPLPVNGSYTDGSNAKWLWILSDDLDNLEITATDANGKVVELDVGRVLSSSTGGNEWPSIIDLPEPGCWTFDITASTPDGSIYEGRIVFPVVP